MTEPTDDGIRAFIEALRPIQVTAEGPYRKIDRYRDFHAVFGSDGGKRVLSQIIDHCEGRPLSEADAHDGTKLVWRTAMRSVGLWISATAATPPRQTEG